MLFRFVMEQLPSIFGCVFVIFGAGFGRQAGTPFYFQMLHLIIHHFCLRKLRKENA